MASSAVPALRPVARAMAVLSLFLAGCSAEHGRPAPAAPDSPVAIGPDGRAGCAPPSPVSTLPPLTGTGPGSPEVRGTGHGAQLSGLVMVPFRSPLVRAGDHVKIVWRMTGSGDLTLSAIGPDGRHRRLDWGPEPHGGSTYHRPGAEWGAGYHFDRPGCWHLRAVRGTASADVWLKVAKR